MRCIQCQTDNTLKDRTSNYGRCKHCQHAFVFEPTNMGTLKLTDAMFAKAIADLSANNTLYFTLKQLFYLLDKRFQAKQVFGAVTILILCAILTLFSFAALVVPSLVVDNPWPLLAPGITNLLFLYLLWYMSSNQVTSVKARRIAARCLVIQGLAIVIVSLLVSLATQLFPVFAYGVVVGILACYLGVRNFKVQVNTAQKTLLELSQVQGWILSWQRVNATPKLLSPPNENALPATVNPDVTAYSFDRLVVTDTAAIAQLLIANNFHFENNSAILSITGYPQSIFQTTMEMLRRNPDLQVYAFHDCSGKGMSLVHHLQTSSQWFADSNVDVFDVGLRPQQVITLPNVVIQKSAEFAQVAQQLPASVRQRLSADELTWLDEGNVVLLESFTPQRLIQALNRGIASSRNLLQGDRHTSGDDLIWVGDTGGSTFYSVDSFG